MSAWIAVLLLLAAGSALLLGLDTAGLTGLEPGEFATASASLAFLVFIASSVLSGYRGRMGRALRDASIWTLITLALVSGYSFRDELGGLAYRIAGELAPAGSGLRVENIAEGERAVRIRRRTDSHFVAKVQTNGATLTMLVDTGASTVVLGPADAKRIGIDMEKLRYTVPVQTANGTTYAAPIRLKSITVGPITIKDVDALVSKPGALRDSLLGMSFLNRLRSYEFSGEYLTLRI